MKYWHNNESTSADLTMLVVISFYLHAYLRAFIILGHVSTFFISLIETFIHRSFIFECFLYTQHLDDQNKKTFQSTV